IALNGTPSAGCVGAAFGRVGASPKAATGTGRPGAGEWRISSPVVTKPTLITRVASVATRMVGSFLGKYGVLLTTAREMMRVSGGALPMVSRAVASRYFAR